MGGRGGGAGGGIVSTPAQVRPLSTASTHAKREAHLHPRMRGGGALFCVNAVRCIHACGGGGWGAVGGVGGGEDTRSSARVGGGGGGW